MAQGIYRSLASDGYQEVLSEEQIERQVEWRMDSLDRQLMDGSLSQSDYDLAVKRLDAWSEGRYAARRRWDAQ